MLEDGIVRLCSREGAGEASSSSPFMEFDNCLEDLDVVAHIHSEELPRFASALLCKNDSNSLEGLFESDSSLSWILDDNVSEEGLGMRQKDEAFPDPTDLKFPDLEADLNGTPGLEWLEGKAGGNGEEILQSDEPRSIGPHTMGNAGPDNRIVSGGSPPFRLNFHEDHHQKESICVQQGMLPENVISKPIDLKSRLKALVEQNVTHVRLPNEQKRPRTSTLFQMNKSNANGYLTTVLDLGHEGLSPFVKEHSSIPNAFVRPSANLGATKYPNMVQGNTFVSSHHGSLLPTSMHSVERPMKFNSERLRNHLLEFAEAVATDNVDMIQQVLPLLREESSIRGDPMQRVAFYALEAIHARMAGSGWKLLNRPWTTETFLKALGEFTYTTPFVPFMTSASNQMLLEALEGETRIHIVDFGRFVGQWVDFLSYVARWPRGPPHVRLTTVRNPDTHDPMLGLASANMESELHKKARLLGVPFEWQEVICPFEQLQPSLLSLRAEEALAFCCTLQLQKLFDSSVLRSDPRGRFLQMLQRLRPRLLVMSEDECNVSGPFFLLRFRESLDNFHSFCEALEPSYSRADLNRQVVEQYVALHFQNVISCDGLQRVYRIQLLEGWCSQMWDAGFTVEPPSHRIVDNLQQLVTRYEGNFNVKVRQGAVFLVRDNQPQLFTCGWRVRY